MARDTHSFGLHIKSSVVVYGANTVQFGRWIRFDRGSHKFVTTKYGVDLTSPAVMQTDDSPRTLVKPVEHDAAMPDARPAVDNTSTAAKSSRDQFEQYFANDSDITRSEDSQQNDKDVMMTDMGLKGIDPKRNLAKPDPLSWLRGGLGDQKSTSPPKKFQQDFVSDVNKLEAMTDFDKFGADDSFKV